MIAAQWRECKLGDVIELKRGYDLPKPKRIEGNVPIISSSGESGSHNEAKAKGPGVVTGRYGTLGEVFYIEKDFWPLNTALYVKDFKGNDPRFISYFMTQLNFSGQNVAGAVPGVNRNYLHMLDVVLPKVDIQRQIADVLSTYDNLIQNNNRRIAILEEMAQSLYREWFVKFRFPGHEDTKFIDSPLGKIPEGWEIKTASEIFSINIGKTPPRKQPQWFSKENIGIKWVSIKDMGACKNYVLDTGENLTLESIEKFNVKVIPSNTVIMSFKLTVGKVAITTENMATNEAIAHFNIKDSEGMCKEFIYSYLTNFRFQTLGNTSSIGNAINSRIVKAMPVLFPAPVVINSYKKLVVPVFKKILIYSKINKNLKKQRDLLLPKLISGIIEL